MILAPIVWVLACKCILGVCVWRDFYCATWLQCALCTDDNPVGLFVTGVGLWCHTLVLCRKSSTSSNILASQLHSYLDITTGSPSRATKKFWLRCDDLLVIRRTACCSDMPIRDVRG